jgi:uncharacterized membrane protein
MDVLQIVLRIVHILAGVFWVGSAYVMVFFVAPTAAELGPEGGKFMAGLSQRRKLPMYSAASAYLTILAGLVLYWRSSDGLDPDWIVSGPGVTFTVGGVAAIIALVLGATVIGTGARRLGPLTAQAAAAQGPPSPETAAELQRLGARMRSGSIWIALLLTIAVVAMAVARYV